MDAIEHQLYPVAIALHTRDRQEDYRWYAESRSGQLIGQFKELYRGLIADQDANPASTFILLDQGARLGLLVANLKSVRKDHQKTSIYDTLVLEFNSADRAAVYRLAAGLLTEEAPALQKTFLDYAEIRFQQHQETGHLSIEPIAISLVTPITGSEASLIKYRVGLRSNQRNQRRVARLLHQTASKPDMLERPVVVVSTGFVDRKKLQQHSLHGGSFIALTRSKSIEDDEEVALAPTESEKKKSGRVQPRMVIASLGLLGLFGVTLLGAWALRGRTPPNFSTDSGTKLPNEAEMTNAERASLRTATFVGIGAASHGNGDFLVVPALLAEELASAQGPR